MNELSNRNNKLDFATIKNAAMVLRAVNNKFRQEILQVLHVDKSMKVTDIYVKLRREQSITSQQLAILRNANIVSIERRSTEVFYYLNSARIKQLSEALKDFTSE